MTSNGILERCTTDKRIQAWMLGIIIAETAMLLYMSQATDFAGQHVPFWFMFNIPFGIVSYLTLKAISRAQTETYKILKAVGLAAVIGIILVIVLVQAPRIVANVVGHEYESCRNWGSPAFTCDRNPPIDSGEASAREAIYRMYTIVGIVTVSMIIGWLVMGAVIFVKGLEL